jgi:type I restriction-modification system DNA methylase subunit
MLADDIVDAVIGLPSGTLPGLSIEPALLICRLDRKDEKRAGHILFIDASQRRDALRSSSAWQALADEIVSIYSSGTDSPSLARVATRTEVEHNLSSLQPRRYIARDMHLDPIDPRAALEEAAVHEAEATRNAAIMDRLLDRLDTELSSLQSAKQRS